MKLLILKGFLQLPVILLTQKNGQQKSLSWIKKNYLM